MSRRRYYDDEPDHYDDGGIYPPGYSWNGRETPYYGPVPRPATPGPDSVSGDEAGAAFMARDEDCEREVIEP
jgi:hypothetical protein